MRLTEFPASTPETSPTSAAIQSGEDGDTSPFRFYPADAPEQALMFASPHSGSVYPEDMRERLGVPVMDLRRTEDAFVDELFRPATRLGGSLLAARYARAYVDLNRDASELDPGMFLDGPPRPCGIPGARVQAGLGSLPRVGASGRNIYTRRMTRAEGEARLAGVHDAYHTSLRKELHRLRRTHGAAFLVDCHSMPSVQPGRRGLAEIVLGDRFGSSCCGRLTSAAERAFRRLGYRVARNAPYAGGYTTRQYGRPRSGIHVLQIEVRRDLYMDETSVVKTAGFTSLLNDLASVCDDLLTHVAGRAPAR